MPDRGHELEDDEEGRGQDGEEVELHADFVGVVEVVVALSWQSTVEEGVAEDAVEGEVLEAGEGEAEEVATRWSAGEGRVCGWVYGLTRAKA